MTHGFFSLFQFLLYKNTLMCYWQRLVQFKIMCSVRVSET